MAAGILAHPEIGEVQGITNDGVEQYLGIQYATLSDRFAPAVLKEYHGEGIDATKIGLV
jgi:carboxylesterase type B